MARKNFLNLLKIFLKRFKKVCRGQLLDSLETKGDKRDRRSILPSNKHFPFQTILFSFPWFLLLLSYAWNIHYALLYFQTSLPISSFISIGSNSFLSWFIQMYLNNQVTNFVFTCKSCLIKKKKKRKRTINSCEPTS